MSSATFQSAAWDCEPFRWRSVLVIAATNPVAGLESYQSRRGAGIWRCIRHQVALREPWHRGDWLSAAKHTCPEASARHRSPDGTSHWTRGGATSTGQRLLRRTIKRDAVTNSRRRNLSAIQDIVRSDNLTNLAINAAPYNGWRFSGDPITTRNDLARMARQRRENNRCPRSGSRLEQPRPQCRARSSAANA